MPLQMLEGDTFLARREDLSRGRASVREKTNKLSGPSCQRECNRLLQKE